MVPESTMPNNNVLTERQRMDLLLVADDMEVSGDAKLADALRALLAAHPGQPEPIAWESTTVAYTKYITDERYQKFSPEVRKWYKPYRCSACSEALAEAMDDDKVCAERYRCLRRGQHWSVINGIGDTLRADELDAAIDAARAGEAS